MNAFERARSNARAASVDPQQRNRLWWETLPMTYEDWEASQRSQAARTEDFLANNPWLGKLNFSALRRQKVLVVGCGTGPEACLFAKAGASTTAIDLTSVATRLAAINARQQGLDVFLCQMDAERLAFRPGAFDYAFAWGVLHHSATPTRAFGEVNRVLVPGGRGLIMVYNRLSLRYYLKGLYWLVVKGKIMRVGCSLSKVQRYFTDGYYHRHFSAGELTRHLSESGLMVTRVSITHMAKKMIPLIPRRLDDYLKRTVGWLLVVEFVKQPLGI